MQGAVSPFRVVLAALLVALSGAVLLPWQAELCRTARQEGFHSVALDIGLREQVGQSAFLAALSGFRSPVAALLWIEAHGAWEKTEWGRMAGLFNTVTSLQPHGLLYWDIAAWHMAWNASVAAQQDRNQKSEILRERSRRQYIQLGKDFLERGIRNNPGSYLLHERLAILERDKLGDHAAASAEYAKAAALPGAPPYVARFAAYEAAEVPGMEGEAYRMLRALYDQGERKYPSLVAKLRQLEEKLGIPADQRVPAASDNGRSAPAPKS
jgi:hypothetical protein